MARAVATLAAAAIAAAAAPFTATIDISRPGRRYDGIGALSGGGGVTRLLIDYDPALQQRIYDALFLPRAGAALQIIKVEIGGDSQSTEGTEQSHEHFRGDLNCSRGYEWAVLEAAKARNPDIRTYGLTWAVPGWLGNGTGNFFTDDNVAYHVDWVRCAQTHNIAVDYIGIWNERSYQAAWVQDLRAALDDAGFNATAIVVADDGGWGVAADLASDPAFAAAVWGVGVHYPYPNAPTAVASGLGMPLWASEEWDLGKVADWDGAMKLAETLNGNAINNMSATIVWNLIGSWYAFLPFSYPDGTPTGEMHSLMYAAEPWSGHYELRPPLAVVAHTTQFTETDGHWRYGDATTGGIGSLPGGGSYVSVWSTSAACGALPISIIVETMAATAPQTVSFTIANAPNGVASPLYLWSTNETVWFTQLAPVPLVNGTATLTLAPGTLYTLTTTQGQGWVPESTIPPSAPLPFPYADAFDGYAAGAYARYFSDEGGIFIVQPRPDGNGSALFQVITDVPIAWEPNPLPYTLLGPSSGAGSVGMWTDYTVAASLALDASVNPDGNSLSLVQMDGCSSGNTTQQFLVHSASGGLGTPATLESVAVPGWCIGTNGVDPSIMDAPRVALVPCANATVRWQLNATTSQVQATDGSGNCIDVGASNTAAGAQVITWQCKPAGSNSNQQWTVGSGGGGGSVTLVSQLEGMCATEVPTAGTATFVTLCGRIGTYTRGGPPPNGYCLSLLPGANTTAPGTFTLSTASSILASGQLPGGGPLMPGMWYDVDITFKGSNVTARIGGITVASLVDSSYTYGMMAVGSGWHNAWFDNVAITAPLA